MDFFHSTSVPPSVLLDPKDCDTRAWAFKDIDSNAGLLVHECHSLPGPLKHKFSVEYSDESKVFS